MQVNIYISCGTAEDRVKLLVIPYGPNHFVPNHLKHIAWRQFGTADASDRLLGDDATKVKEELLQEGYSLVYPSM